MFLIILVVLIPISHFLSQMQFQHNYKEKRDCSEHIFFIAMLSFLYNARAAIRNATAAKNGVLTTTLEAALPEGVGADVPDVPVELLDVVPVLPVVVEAVADADTAAAVFETPAGSPAPVYVGQAEDAV